MSYTFGSPAFIYANEEIDNLLGILSDTVKVGGRGGVEKGAKQDPLRFPLSDLVFPLWR